MMLSQTLEIAAINSCLVHFHCVETFCFSFAHRFSIGLRSGLFPGHSSTSISFAWNHAMHLLVVWQGAPSHWKIKEGFDPKISPADGSIFGFKTSSMYLLAFILPSSTWILPTVLLDMQPHIMMLTGCFIVGAMHSGRHSSPTLCWTYLTPSLPNMEMHVLSLHKTLLESSLAHWRYSLSQFTLFCLCFLFRHGIFLRILASNPGSTSQRRMVLLLTSTPLSKSFSDVSRSFPSIL